MKKISWFTPSATDISGLSWYSQGYSVAALQLIAALREKEIAVFYNKNDIQ